MKQKFYILMFISFLLTSLELTTVKADNLDLSLSISQTSQLSDNSEVNPAKEETEIKAVTEPKKTTKVKKIKKTTKIKVNDTLKIKKLLNAKKFKIKNYTFKSNNKKAAKVTKQGVITGINAGTASITVTSKADRSVYAVITVTVENKYSESDLRYMASIIYSEARGECYAGQKAVGIVVMNRVKSSLFPNSIKGVLYQSGQFTPARNGSLNRSLSLYDQGKLSKSCLKAAKEVLNGDTTVFYNNQTYNLKGYLFFSRYVYGCKLQIQHHQFK